MSSTLEAARIDDQIRRIHRELKQNFDRLLQKEREAEQFSPEIPDLESRVSLLQSELSSLESETARFHSDIDFLRRDREHCDQQTAQIRQLTSEFSAQNSTFSVSPIPDLPSDIRSQVLSKITEILDTIAIEYRGFDSEEYTASLQQNHEMQSAIDRELSILTRLPHSDWEIADDFRDRLEEFCLRYYPEELSLNGVLSEIEIPCLSEPLQVLERKLNPQIPAPPRIQQLRSEISNIVGILRNQQNQEIKVYQEQLRFFEKLKECLDRATAVDVSIIENQFHERLKMLKNLNEIRPLQIPQFTANPQQEIDPFDVLSIHFADFCEVLRKSGTNSIVTEIEEAADRALSIPEFALPPTPKLVKHSIQSSDLTELAGQLRTISETTKTIVPIGTLQSLTNSHRTALLTDPPLFQSEPLRGDELFESNDDQWNLTSFEAFRNAALSKLPPELAKRFELPDSSSLVPQIEEFECEEDAENLDADELKFESNLENRTILLNSLLRTMASIEIPSPPIISEPIQVSSESELVDPQPLLDAVDQVLSPEHQNTAVLADEIRDLEMRLDATLREIAAFEEEESDESERIALEEEVAVRGRELESLKKRVQDEVEIVKALKAERTKLTEQNSALQVKVNESEELEEELRQAEEELRRKQAELRSKKKNFEEEEQLWANLHVTEGTLV
jgi:hypothetical protein